jgi:hypothetical protein
MKAEAMRQRAREQRKTLENICKDFFLFCFEVAAGYSFRSAVLFS